MNQQEKLAMAHVYLDHGLSVIPITPGSKKPLIPWKEFQTRHPSHEEIDEWLIRFPDFEVGVVTGPISRLVVADGDRPEAVTLIEKVLPYTPIRETTKRGCHFFFRYPEGIEVPSAALAAQGIDIQSGGKQVVVAPSSGRTWVWDNGDLNFDDCPTYDPRWTGMLVGNGAAPAAGNLSGVVDMASAKVRIGKARYLPAGEGGRNNTLVSFAGQVARLPDLDLDTFAMMVHSQNRTYSPPLDDGEVNALVTSIWTRQLGQRDETVAARYIAPPPDELAPELVSPGGVIGKIMAYIEGASRFYHPEFALGAALACLGAVVGGCLQTDTGLRTNLYVLAIGESGSGKDAPMHAIATLLQEAGLEELLGPGSFASPAAVYKTLTENNRQLCLIDELGHYLVRVKGGGHASGIMPVFTKLYTSAGKAFFGDAYAASDREKVKIKSPHLCLYGTSVPGVLYDNLSPDDVSDGFLPRWMIFEVDRPQPPARRNITMAVPYSLRSAIASLAVINKSRTPSPAPGGNLEAVMAADPCLVAPETDEAADMLMAYVEKCRVTRNAVIKDDRLYAGVLNRCGEHAAKLALLKLVSDYGPDVVSPSLQPMPIGKEQMAWGIAVADHLAATLIHASRHRIGANDWDRYCQKVLDCIKRNKGAGMSRREICQRVRGLKVAEVAEVLDILILRGDIDRQEVANVTRYSLAAC